MRATFIPSRRAPGARAVTRPHRHVRRHRRSRAAKLLTALVVLVPTLATGPAVPTGAATTTLRQVSVLDAGLTGVNVPTGTKEPYASPAIADITGDGVSEIVVGTLDGRVIAYSSSFTVLWQRSTGSAIQASPVIADIGGDGRADVVAATMHGRIYWFDGLTGATQRSYAEGAPLHCPAGVDCRPHGFFATPAVGDITGDGKPEILAASYDHTLYAWDARTGYLRWRKYLFDTLWSSPVIADVDRNGTKEVVLGGDIHPNNPLGVPPGGLLWVVNSNGTTRSGYPIHIPNQTVWSSPAVTDLNGDGGEDIIVGTGTFGEYGDSATSRRVYAFSARSRRSLPGWPVSTAGRVTHAPAVGDIDSDGHKEVVFGSEGGYVYAHDHTGGRKWAKCVAVEGRCADRYPTHGSAVIADVDADGRQEVLAAMDKDLFVLDGGSGGVEASFRLSGAKTLAPAALPAVGETGGGKSLIAVNTVWDGASPAGSSAGDTNRLYVFTTDKCVADADWGSFKRDAGRSAFLGSSGRGWAPFTCVRPFLAQQYRDFLGRGYEEDGLRFWAGRMTNGGWSGPRTIRAFMDSTEFSKFRSPLVRTYVALTGTAPTSHYTFTGQADRLRRGTSINTIAQEMAASPNVRDRNGVSPSAKPDATFVKDTYVFVYGRQPTANEQAMGTAALAGGTKRGDWANAIAQTGTAAARLTPEVYTAMSYLGMLGRVPERSGYDYWVSQVRRGVSIDGLLRQFQASTEYARRIAPNNDV